MLSNETVIIVLLAIILGRSQNAGMYKTVLTDFDKFISVNANAFKNASADFHPTSIEGDKIEDFVFNVGLSTKTQCDRKAIACIKYKGDNNFYSVSSAKTWDYSQIGTDVSFVSDVTVRLVLPPSENSYDKIHSLDQVQLTIEFTYSEVTEINLISESSSNLLLVLAYKRLNQYVSDHVSLYCENAKYYIAIALIAFGFFMIIRFPTLYKFQIISLQLFVIISFILY